MPATVTPEVPTAAVFAKMDRTAVAQDDGHLFPADLTEFLAVGDDHGEYFSWSVNFPALIYMMNVEKASALPESGPEKDRKQSIMKTAPHLCFKALRHESSEKVDHP
jgi:hypothetical protein